MIITVASFKGGVAKTTSSVHLAALLSKKAATALIDGDPNRSATGWGKRGKLPFPIVDERAAAKRSRDFEYLVIDTEARPDADDIKALSESCDLWILPSSPDALALEAMMQTIETLQGLNANHFKVLLTIVPPKPSRDGEEARSMLLENELPVFKQSIPRLVAFQKAALAGVTVNEVADPRAEQGWKAYQAIAKELLL